MEASIHSRDDWKDNSQGKTSRVYSEKISTSCLGGLLTIRAEEEENSYPEQPFAETSPREITRKLSLKLTAPEIKQILVAAIRGGLVEVDVVVADKWRR